MPWYPVKQPNDMYAVFSTISDRLAAVDLSADELPRKMREWYNEYTVDELTNKLEPAIDRMAKGLTAWEWSQDWNFCLQLHVYRHGVDDIIEILVANSVCSAAEIEQRVADARTEQVRNAIDDALPTSQPLRELVRIDAVGNVSIVDNLTIEEAKDVITRLVVALRECQERQS